MPWPPSPDPGKLAVWLMWTVMPAPGPIGALTVGATADGLALVVFGDHPEAAAQAAERLGVAASGADRTRRSAGGGTPARRRSLTPIPGAGVNGAERPGSDRGGSGAVAGVLRGRAAGVRPAAGLVAHPRFAASGARTLFATVGYGETVTYGELAARSELGSAYTAARGVGAIMGSNPFRSSCPATG